MVYGGWKLDYGFPPVRWIDKNIPTIECDCGESNEAMITLTEPQHDEGCILVKKYKEQSND